MRTLEETVRQCVCFVYHTAGRRAHETQRACVATVLTLFPYHIPSPRRTVNRNLNVLRQCDFVKRMRLYCIASSELRESLFSEIFVDFPRFCRRVTDVYLPH